MSKRNTAPAAASIQAPEKFCKRAILRDPKYRRYEPLLTALLEDGETYTLEEVDELLDCTLKGKVM